LERHRVTYEVFHLDFSKGTYKLADAHVLENVLEFRVGLDVVVGKPSMDEAVVLVVIEVVADRLKITKQGREQSIQYPLRLSRAEKEQ
jgi:hypothetical protein